MKLSNLKKILFVLPTVYLIMSLVTSSGHKELKIGKKAPLTNVAMKNIDDHSISLNDLKQENGLIIVFSCNTCPFVVGNTDFEGWEKQYNDLNEKALAQKIGFVLVNSNEAKREGNDSLDEMKKHAKNADYKMPYLIDKNSALANAFGAKTTPHVFVLDKENKLVYKGSIDNMWDSKRISLEQYVYNAMSNLANGNAIEINDTPPRGCSIKRL